MGGLLIRRLAGASGPFLGGQLLADTPTQDELLEITGSTRQARRADVGLGVAIYPGEHRQEVYFVLITPDGASQSSRPYGGPPEYASRWALHLSLDMIRNL